MSIVHVPVFVMENGPKSRPVASWRYESYASIGHGQIEPMERELLFARQQTPPDMQNIEQMTRVLLKRRDQLIVHRFEAKPEGENVWRIELPKSMVDEAKEYVQRLKAASPRNT